MDFRSDNVGAVAPAIMDAIVRANEGTAGAYGGDDLTQKLDERFSELFGTEVRVFPALTGTAANAITLSALSPPYGSIFCGEHSHIATDECGAPELMTGGAKLMPIAGDNAKVPPDALAEAIARSGTGFVHCSQPAALSLTQATEMGAVYSVDEVAKLADVAKQQGLAVHMDGARFANAVSTLGVHPGDLTWRAGVDALSFGATKNGALAAEAIVLFRTDIADDLAFRHKRAGQLLSKMRFIAAQLLTYIDDGLWLDLAGSANAKAQRLTDGFAAMSGAKLEGTGEANEVFVTLRGPIIEGLKAAGAQFYGWPEPWEATNTIRLVTRWDTTDGEVDDILAQTRTLLAQT